MKRTMITAAFCCYLSASGAQTAQTLNGTSYFLPKTALRFTLLTEKTTYKPGDFCDYANRYLKTAAETEPYTKYNILSIKMDSYGIPDTAQIFTAKMDAKHNITELHRDNNGVLLAVNTRPKALPEEKPFVAAPKPRPVNPRNYLTQEILATGSKAKMAELTADEIYDIRESRSLLNKGQADYMPKDGEQLKTMLANLDMQESALLQLFNGVTETDTAEIVITYIPTKEVEKEVLFRFSKHQGVVDKDDLSGSPYYISIADQHSIPTNTATIEPGEKNKNDAGIYVNLPGRIGITIHRDGNTWAGFEAYASQFGRTEAVLGDLFSKKLETKMQLNPATGNVETINTEYKK